MKDDLATLNPNFLDKFPLTIQKGTLIKDITGGVVLGTENDRKINSTTCDHESRKGNKVMNTKCRKNFEQENEKPKRCEIF